MHNTPAKPTLTELVASYMAMLEERLALEAKYPDWHEDADAEFEDQEFRSNRIAHQIADFITAKVHVERHAALIAAEDAAADKRRIAFDEWYNTRGEMEAA